ncbi:MAG: hypothetical protein JWO13_2991 [Acidobacteriales bacterium]|nr:hypothetical protein [Terriglobales bacterium]
MLAQIIFLLCLLFAASPLPWASPPVALALGVAFGLAFNHPFATLSRNWSKILLQVSVVGLGFGMNLQQVLQAGRSGFIYTLLGIAFALAAGWSLGKILRVRPNSSYLISVGTAICGGSAIAAVAPVINASDEELSVSIGTVFILNAIGLLVFPPLGHALHLTEPQFGLWAALAIHDTSSVVGAGAKFGAIALAVATTVKLARALWIVPVTLGTAALREKKDVGSAAVQWPWFILFFLAAAVMNTYVAPGNAGYTLASRLARTGLTVTLFLIGTGISRASLKQVGVRPLAQGIALWLLVAVVSLTLIRMGLIAI